MLFLKPLSYILLKIVLIPAVEVLELKFFYLHQEFEYRPHVFRT